MPHGLVRVKMGKLQRERGDVLFVEGTRQLKVGMTVCMFEGHGTAMLLMQAEVRRQKLCLCLSMHLMQSFKMIQQTVPVSCKCLKLLKFLLREKVWLI